MKTNGIPQWWREICEDLSIQQAEIFVLHGDVSGYPQYPGESLPTFLQRATMSPSVKRAKDNPGSDALAEQIFLEVSPATGLGGEEAHVERFNQIVPAANDNPFAAAAGGSITDDFGRLSQYFAISKEKEAPALGLVIHDADLLFDSNAPMVEPERTLTSYIRKWASRPLITSARRAHRIFLIAPTQDSVRSTLMQGRVEPIKLPMPTEAERGKFVDKVLDQQKEIGFEVDLDAPTLARITGALNLLQVEDVMYQSLLTEDLKITRAMAQERKDKLVQKTYGGVLEISYPTVDFDVLVGYDELKRYFTDYVTPKLRSADQRCPKGCVLTGPPGTGKTVFAGGLAAKMRMPLVIFRGDLVKDKFVGESNKKMQQLLEGIVALAPCVVMLDEIDKVLPTGDDNTGVSQEILGALQTFMSDVERGKIFFIATTNFPSRIPRALLRPGRFEQVIPLLPKHLDGERDRVINRVAEKLAIKHNISIDQMSTLGDDAEGYTGADVEKLLIEADREATEAERDHITFDDVKRSLDYVVPTLKTTQPMVDEALEYCSNRRYVPQEQRDKVGETTLVDAEPAQKRQRVSVE